jgi:hypothetical protein
VGLLTDLFLGALLEPEDQEKVRRFLQKRERETDAKAARENKQATIETDGQGEDIP